MTVPTLTVREGAGLYLVRRARTMVGPYQLRLLATAFLGLLVLDLGRLALDRSAAGHIVDWGAQSVQAGVWTALALLLWRPRLGLILAAAALISAALAGGTGTEPLLLLCTGVAAISRGIPAVSRFYALGGCAYLALIITLNPTHVGFIALWFGGAIVFGVAIGEGLRRLLGRGRPEREAADALTEDARLRADERRLLTRELHDVVTHQLSNISLQVMGHRDSEDAAQLRRSLRRIGTSSDAALTELRLLVRVLRDDSATAAGVDEVAELTQRISPTAAAAEWARRLTAAGFEPSIEVPAGVDRLGMTTQRTLSRAMDVVGANILAWAAPQSSCSLIVNLNATQVVLRAVNHRVRESPPGPGAEPLGWGLRGLRERVSLTGGTLQAGPAGTDPRSKDDRPDWVVVLSLPHD